MTTQPEIDDLTQRASELTEIVGAEHAIPCLHHLINTLAERSQDDAIVPLGMTLFDAYVTSERILTNYAVKGRRLDLVHEMASSRGSASGPSRRTSPTTLPTALRPPAESETRRPLGTSRTWQHISSPSPRRT